MVKFSTAVLGFGRMGPNREFKFALEKYWKKDISCVELLRVANQVEEEAWKLQVEAGIDRITVGDFCLYDQIATWSEMLGIVPSRFAALEQGIDRMFAMCRGIDDATALSKFPSLLPLLLPKASTIVAAPHTMFLSFWLYYCRHEEMDYIQLSLHGPRD
jgi:5-methyltetrahydropteroyltriglutamate--homocysteine methyltransferase